MVGELLGGRYQILAELGKGSCGKTYLAEDLHLPGKPRRVVKQLLVEKTPEYYKDYFDREAEVLMELGQGCTQIPKLHAHFEVDDVPYLVQDYIEGRDLSKEIACHQDVLKVKPAECWPEQKVIDFLVSMLGVLEYIHSQNVVHRDVKPANIMRRSADQMLFLIDFGIVKDISIKGSNIKPGTQGIGSQGYMPSEQVRGIPQPNSDIYSLGMTAIQALTGIYPLQLLMAMEEGQKGIRWARFAEVSPALANIIDRMVLEDAKDRYQSAQEVLKALNSIKPLNSLESSDSTVQPLKAKALPQTAAKPKPSVSPPQKLHQKKATFNVATVNLIKELGDKLIFSLLFLVMAAGVMGIGFWFDHQAKLSKRTVEEIVDSANQAIKEEKYRKAISEASLAIKKNAFNTNAYFYRAMAKSHSNDNQGAVVDYDKAIAIDPRNSHAYYNRGILKKNKLNDTQGALADYNKAISINPQNSHAYNNRGNLKTDKLNDTKGALADYNKAISIDPQNSHAYNNRGNLKADKLKDKAGAIADFRQAAKLYQQQKNQEWFKRSNAKLQKLGEKPVSESTAFL